MASQAETHDERDEAGPEPTAASRGRSRAIARAGPALNSYRTANLILD